ncbi:MAG: TolC family protein [Bacteroidales bacterium]
MQRTLKKIFFILALAFLGFAPRATAQNEEKFSLERAIEHALEHNKNVINANLSVNEADERLKETIAQGLPQIDATVDYSNFFGSSASLGAMPGMGEFTIDFDPTSNLSVSVGQLVFSGSYIVGIQTAKLFKEMTKTSLEKSELDIKAQVTEAYILSLISMESKAVMVKNIENMKEVLNKTKKLVEVGVAEEIDYDQLSVQVSMLENGLRAAERQVELALNMLRLQIGLQADVSIILTDEIDDIVGESEYQTSLLQPFELQNNFDFKLMEFQTDIAKKQINMEKSAYLPTIAGFYNYTEKILKADFDINPNHVIGVNVSIPIFSSGARRSKVNQAKINHEITENQRDLLSEQLMIQEKQLRYNLRNAVEQYESQKANVEVAMRVYKNLNNKYQQGIISSLDLTTANNNYLQAENNYISAKLQLMEAQIALDKLLNKL